MAMEINVEVKIKRVRPKKRTHIDYRIENDSKIASVRKE